MLKNSDNQSKLCIMHYSRGQAEPNGTHTPTLQNWCQVCWVQLGSPQPLCLPESILACHVPQQPPQSPHLVQLGGWATLRSAEEMLDGLINEWTSLPKPELLTMASCGKDWRTVSAESSTMSSPTPPHPKRLTMTQLVKGLN